MTEVGPPPADPALLASANRELHAQIERLEAEVERLQANTEYAIRCAFPLLVERAERAEAEVDRLRAEAARVS